MPVWHEATKKWVAEGRLVLLGVVQEQHADRCGLFAQWQQLEWPILHDPINILENQAVPIVIAIDESGVVRSTRPNPKTLEQEFLRKDFSKHHSTAIVDSRLRITPPRDFAELEKVAQRSQDPRAWRGLGDALMLWHGDQKLAAAIQAYQSASQLKPERGSDRGALLFRLGVAWRRKYESPHGTTGDFSRAVRNWKMALDTNPNQYIWRRRIQQYGPRLDKPYPFYDWVAEARQAIQQRGELPVALRAEPLGAELAQPARELVPGPGPVTNPDPEGRLRRDGRPHVQIETVVVPHTQNQQSVMVHLRLALQSGAHWNNEGEPLQVWLEIPENWRTSQQRIVLPSPDQAQSEELRHVEFEIQLPTDRRQPATLNGYALYGICGDAGQCVYLRNDFRVRID